MLCISLFLHLQWKWNVRSLMIIVKWSMPENWMQKAHGDVHTKYTNNIVQFFSTHIDHWFYIRRNATLQMMQKNSNKWMQQCWDQGESFKFKQPPWIFTQIIILSHHICKSLALYKLTIILKICSFLNFSFIFILFQYHLNFCLSHLFTDYPILP